MTPLRQRMIDEPDLRTTAHLHREVRVSRQAELAPASLDSGVSSDCSYGLSRHTESCSIEPQC